MRADDLAEIRRADAVGKASERERVRGLRQRGISWAHIAQQLGKAERDVRLRYDRPGFP